MFLNTLDQSLLLGVRNLELFLLASAKMVGIKLEIYLDQVKKTTHYTVKTF